MSKTKEQLLTEKREINSKLGELVAKREKTEDEVREMESLTAQYNQLNREIETMSQMEREAAAKTPKSKETQMREFLQGAKENRENEIVVGTTAAPGAGLDSGAIDLTIRDLIPNLEEGTGLPGSLPVVMGVTGNVIYPTDASDMEIEEAGEVAVLDDQTVDFDNVKVEPVRVTLSCDISNKLIDNLHFPILPHIAGKFQKAWRKYCATKVYSQANFAGVKGGFANLTAAGTITLGGKNSAAQILSAVAAFINKGLDPAGVCLVIDATTEALLKAEPKVKGEGNGFIIEGGKLLGYDYVVTHRINTVLGGDSKTDPSHTNNKKLYPTTDKYMGIGFFQYLPLQQHGEWRLTVDATSKAQMKKNCVGMVLNTEVSLTDLSKALYDEDGNNVSAFAIYKIEQASEEESTPAPIEVKVVNDEESPVITQEVTAGE